MNEVKLIENKSKGTFTVTVNGVPAYNPFTDEIKAKAAAFDECIKSIYKGSVTVSYLSY